MIYKRLLLILIAINLWAGLHPFHAIAATDQIYFVGMTAPLGSISQPGAARTAVFLRWDVVEGGLPDSLTVFILKRDGVEIRQMPATGIMGIPGIEALYDGPEQERRKLETIHRLDSLLDRMDDGEDNNSFMVNSGNFAGVIHDRLADDALWTHIGSRMDFNIARARYRAYLDMEAAPGNHVYELWGRFTTGEEALLGKAGVDTVSVSFLPPAGDFNQVRLGRCDAPDRFKDHVSVALNWRHAGNNATEGFLSSLLVSGYDIYRTTRNIDPRRRDTWPDIGEIRTLAQFLPHDEYGNVALNEFEKVNDQPVTISGSGDKEGYYKGWNPPFSQFLETSKELMARGIRPGDTRLYYLVGRDFTGNYTRTAGPIPITVIDMTAPPPPWAIRTVESSAKGEEGEFKLTWDQVDIRNYYDNYKSNRTYCNLETAITDRKLCYVREGENCNTTAHFCVDLDTMDYLVYRFNDPSVASEFTDSDGDGYDNKDERISESDPGTACNLALTPTGKTSYLIGSVNAAGEIILPESGRRVIEFVDNSLDGPAAQKGKVFWYRIAARGQDGNLSELSEPVRGFFPDRTRPLRPQNAAIKTERCLYSVNPSIVRSEKLVPPLFVQDSSGDGAKIVIECLDCSSAFEETLYIIDYSDRGRGVYLSDSVIDILNSRHALKLSFFGYGQELLAGTLAGWSSGNGGFIIPSELVKNCKVKTYESIDPGEVVDFPLTVEVPLEPGQCVALYRDIKGKPYRMLTRCHEGESPVRVVLDESNFPAQRGDNNCLSLDIHNENNVVSSKLRLPCFKIVPTGPPAPPQPAEMVFDEVGHVASVTWIPPQEPVVGTIIEWYLKGSDDRTKRGSKFVSHAGEVAQDGSISTSFDTSVPPDGTDWEEEWCFRGRSATHSMPGGEEGALSGWSATLCRIRLPQAVTALPQYLPWPEIPEPPVMGDLDAEYVQADGLPVVLLTDALTTLPACTITEISPDRTCNMEDPGTPGNNGPATCIKAITFDAGYCQICAGMQAAAAPNLGFVAYRQSRRDASDRPGDFVQVSPLIERVYCKSRYGGKSNVLKDPFLTLANFVTTDPASSWAGIHVVFVDRFPHVAGYEYRYQFVFFDEKGEIRGYKVSDWVKAAL